MNSKKWIQKALSACLAVAVMATGSMITLASSEKVTGELLISGTDANGGNSSVMVNGETAENGRSIFSSSTITTPQNAGAIIKVSKIGTIELAPETNLTLTFNEKGIDGNLSAGRVTVLNASENVSIKTLDGMTNLTTGESAIVSGKAQDDDAASDGGNGWILWAAVLGGAAVGIILAATTDNNRTAFGSGTNVVSPTR